MTKSAAVTRIVKRRLSSWRVSTMGLMNVGKTEGAQIIQLLAVA